MAGPAPWAGKARERNLQRNESQAAPAFPALSADGAVTASRELRDQAKVHTPAGRYGSPGLKENSLMNLPNYWQLFLKCYEEKLKKKKKMERKWGR